MELKLKRLHFLEDRTIGMLETPTLKLWTLEDRVREPLPWQPKKNWKIPKVTAIPRGRYKLSFETSPRFKKRLLRLADVPFFSGVLIHAGNAPDDTDGCILVGRDISLSTPPIIIKSREALAMLQAELTSNGNLREDSWISVE